MIGSIIGPYRVERELGSGGMGTVYAATVERDVAGLVSGTTVALKVVHPHLLQSPGFFKRFLREARIGQKVDHENVVRTFDFDAYESDGQTHHCLAMEYVEGQTLRDLLVELGTVPEDLCRHVGAEMAKGLAAIHAHGAVHRDIKPENVLITPDHVIKLMDLGVARLIDESVRLSQTGAFVGSVHYAAPEQFRGTKEIDGRADLHALGITLFELATGQHPFDAEELPDIIRRVMQERPPRACDAVDGVSAFFADVIDALVEKDVDARLASADLLLSVLDEGERSPWWRDRTQSLTADRARRVRRLSLRRETPVFGREKDLQRLEKAYEKARGGEGAVVLIEGEAGIGKSRLVDEFVRRLIDGGEEINFLSGGFTPADGVGSDGLAAAFREFLGPSGAASHLATMPLIIPSFDAFVRGETPPEGAPVLQAGSVRTCFVRVLQSIAGERTTILLVDDLHFASQDALDLFLSLSLGAPEHPVLILGTMRPGVPPQWLANVSAREHVERVQLERLATGDLVQLLTASLQSESLAEDLARLLSDKADGNPFFVFEILRALRDDGRIVERNDGSWISTHALGKIRIPASIADIVRGRLADLTDEERELLEIAACHGFRFDARLVAHALGTPPLRVLQALARVGRRLGLVRASGDRFEFDHHQVHEALYDELLEPLAREYHAMLAEAIERTALATRIGDDAANAVAEVELCDQWARAGAGVRAYALAERALKHLKDAIRLADAGALVDRLLAALGPSPSRERCDMLTARALLLGARGMTAQALEIAAQAIQVADHLMDSDRQAQTRFRRADISRCSSDTNQQLEWMEEALEYCEVTGDPLLVAACRAIRARAVLDCGGEDRLLDQLQSNVRLFERAGNASWALTARMKIAEYHMTRGNADEAARYYRELIDSAQGARERHGSVAMLGNLAIIATHQGKRHDAIELSKRHRELAREFGDRLAEAEAERNLGNAWIELHRMDDAEPHLLRYCAIARELGYDGHESVGTIGLGNLRARQGRMEEARALREQGVAIAERSGNLQLKAQAYFNLAAQLGREGNLREAGPATERAFAAARAARLVPMTIWTATSLGLLELRLGRNDRAEEHFRFAASTAREAGRPVMRSGALGGLADCAEARGDLQLCEDLWREVVDVHRTTDSPSDIAQSLAWLARAIALQGRRDEALPLFRESLDLAAASNYLEARVIAASFVVEYDGYDVGTAARLIAENDEQGDSLINLQAEMALWRACGDLAFLTSAWERTQKLIAQAPADARDSMRRHMPLYREVIGAWQAHGNGTEA